MILTEDRVYRLSLELEDHRSDVGLTRAMAELAFTNAELLHVVLTCAMPIHRLTPLFMDKRKNELLYKIFLVETALEADGDRLKKSRRTAFLDSSEKSVISYYLGNFFTRLIGRKQFGLDYMTHLNLIEEEDGKSFIEYFGSDWRQDMIGWKPDEDGWSVWEAKGGSNRREPALQKGCQQASEIAEINGKRPEISAACMTFYDHSHLCAVVRDTEIREGKKLSADAGRFLKAYYQPVFELFQEQGMRITGKEAEVTLDIPRFLPECCDWPTRRLRIAMPCRMLQAIAEGHYDELPEIKQQEAVQRDGWYMGPDGVGISNLEEEQSCRKYFTEQVSENMRTEK